MSAGARALRADPEVLDPLANPAVTRALPGLRAALEPRAMAQHVTRALCAPGWRVVDCRPGKATLVPGESAIVRLELSARRGATAPVARALVTARVFRSRRAWGEHA
ncbi:MAG TPA: hypothetical protein VHK89_04195, partial [Actinomycetota bacterium]|nr:hypothetical protein [Actinomycetota bacterium]